MMYFCMHITIGVAIFLAGVTLAVYRTLFIFMFFRLPLFVSPADQGKANVYMRYAFRFPLMVKITNLSVRVVLFIPFVTLEVNSLCHCRFGFYFVNNKQTKKYTIPTKKINK